MKKTAIIKFISTALAILFVLQESVFTFSAFDVNSSGLISPEIKNALTPSETDDIKVKCEVESARNENSKTFLLEDETYYTVYSSVPLHEYCNNTWQDRFNISIEPGVKVKSVEQNIYLAVNNASSVPALRGNQGRNIDSSSERMIINGSGSIGFNQRFINDLNVNSQIYKYQSLWLKPYNLSNTFEDYQTVTVSAKVTLNCQNTNYNNGNIVPVNVYAYRVLSPWDMNINYSLKGNSFRDTQPGSDVMWVNNQILDANSVSETGNYIWDITDCFCKWERGEYENNGVVFTSKNNNMSLTVGGFSFSRRFRIIDEDDSNFGYKTIDMGRAGIVFVNEFTNTVKLVRKELSVNDELLPVEITRIFNYDKNYTVSNPAGLGARWNYESKIGQINSLVLFWKTIDGVTKYFTRSAGNEIENGLQKWVSDDETIMWVDATSTLNENYQNNYIVETDGNKYEFDLYGRLITVVSSFSTLNRPIETQIVYGSNGISKIIDSSGRCFKFKIGNVNGIQCVTELTLYKNEYAADNNIINDIVSINGETVSLEYTYGNITGTNFQVLTSAKYSDDTLGEDIVSYTFDSSNKSLASIVSNDGTVLYLTYNGNSNTLSQLEKKASTAQNANTLELITIDSHNTYQRIISTNGKLETVGYNHLLDLNYRKDSEGNEYYMQYDVNGNPIQVLIPEESENLLTDPGFEEEDTDAWSFYNSNTDFDYDFSPTDTDVSLKSTDQIEGLTGAVQIVNIEGDEGDSFAFGGYGFAGNIIPVDERFYGLVIYESDEYGHQLSTDPIGFINFDNAIINETQYILSSFSLDADVDFITFNLISSHQSEDVWFDDLVLYKVSDGIMDLTLEGEQTGCGCSNCQNGNCLCECGINGTPNCICCNTQAIENRNAFGNIIKSGISINGKEYATTNNYTASGNYLTKTTDENGVETNYVFNADNGMLEEVSEGTNDSIYYSYNALGMLTQVTQAVASIPNTNATVQYSYNNDKISSITHNGVTYNFTYDDYGNCIRELVKDISEATITDVNYTYTNNFNDSRLNSISYGLNNTIYYSYDETTGNITSISFNSTSSPRYTYSYNSDGTLDYSVDNETGLTTTYSSDGGYTITNSNNQILYSITTNNDGQIVESVFGTTYTTGDENIAAEGEFSYDCSTGESSNQMILSGPLDSDIISTVSEDSFERLSNKQYSNKTIYDNPQTTFKLEYEYDDTNVKATNRVKSLTNTHKYIPYDGYFYYGVGDEYSYDSNGRVTSVERTHGLQRLPEQQYSDIISYEYDTNGQVIRENNYEQGSTFIYNYNPYGNIASVETYGYTVGSSLGTPLKTDVYSYDSDYPDLLSSYNNQSITFDLCGNPLSIGSDYEFEWQGKQLVEYRCPFTLDNNHSYQIIRFYYDSEGHQSKKVTYLVDQNDNESLFSTIYYIWKEDKLIAQQTVNSSGTTGNTYRYLYDSNGEAYGFILNDSKLYYYTKDQFGSVIEIYSAERHNCAIFYRYDAWGNTSPVLYWNNLVDYLALLTVLMEHSIAYKGYFYNEDANLYLLKSRFYSPELKRFINSDNSFITGHGIFGANLYSYCANDPVNMYDPNGNAYQGNTKSLLGSIIASITGDVILSLANVSKSDKKTLQNRISNDAEYYYVSSVIYMGKKRLSRRFEVCRAFTNKTVSSIVGKYYSWVEGLGTDKIKKEIFAHAMLFYYFNNVKSFIGEEGANEIRKHADPIDLGGNPWYYTAAFNTIWILCSGT